MTYQSGTPLALSASNTSGLFAARTQPNDNGQSGRKTGPVQERLAFKQFQVTERVRTQFRAEFFNAFNTVRFGTPNTTVTSAWSRASRTRRDRSSSG